jgi:hypothetical protein
MNGLLRYRPLALRHQVINRWLMTGVLTRGERFTPVTMEGDINDWLIHGFSIHENPCRKEFVERRRAAKPEHPVRGVPLPGERVSLWGKEAAWNVYFPWGNPRVEESGFYYVPTHLLRYGYAVVRSPSAHRAVFVLKTCGGVALWVNGEMVCDFAPFTRNIERETRIEIELEAGENVFVVCHEDLAERDTLYHFTLEYTGPEELEILLPVADDAAAEAVRRLEEALDAAYFPSNSVTDGEVRLMFERPPDEPVTFRVRTQSDFPSVPRAADEPPRRTLLPGERELALGHTRDWGTRYQYFILEAEAGGVAIRRRFGIELHDGGFRPGDGASLTVAERKRIALECVARYGSPNIHTAIAGLAVGESRQVCRELILEGLQGIRDRYDCADFYLVALFRLWRDYRDSGLFDEAFWAGLKETILGFRYWIDEPGDDVMWFFSENHALLFHTCQLLAGQLFPDDVFANSGETGARRREKAERLLAAWFDRFFAEGLAEWNSNAYIPIDVLGLVHLHDLAENPELKEKAKRALDSLFHYMTAEAHEGILASTFGRSYEKELMGHHAAGTTSLIWAGYGVGHVNCHSYNVPFYLSDYEPPRGYASRIRLGPREELEFKLEQGKGGYAKLVHYRTRSFVLSSISDFRPGAKGYQEHVQHLAFSPVAQIWVNHPGELYPFGSGRPSFWAGNGCLPKVGQYKGLAVLLFDIDPEHDADYTHAYFPVAAFSRTERRGNWMFASFGDESWAAVYAANGLRMTASGPNRDRELVSPGRRNVWIVRASDRGEFATFERFVEAVAGMPLDASAEELRVRLDDAVYGEAAMDWHAPLAVGGRPVAVEGCGVQGVLSRRERGASES